VSDPIVERIQRQAGVPNLLDMLVERLTPTDLQSLLLEVYRRRAATITPGRLLERYEQDRFVRPSDLAPSLLTEFDRLAWTLLPDRYAAVELSPVCPLGANAVIATVDQHKVVTTIRNTEVVADSTNVLALECATRRRRLLQDNPRSRERVRLCASHRLIRGQAYDSATAHAHFRLLGLCAAGRDEGSFLFETTSLREQLGFFIRLLHEVTHLGIHVAHVRVAITDLEHGRREQALTEHVLDPLRADFPGVQCALDPDRASGRGYYASACFHVYAANQAGEEFQLVDGGFTTWTQQLLSNAKERLLIGGLGAELLCGAPFRMFS
jgi:hypothetical protein